MNDNLTSSVPSNLDHDGIAAAAGTHRSLPSTSMEARHSAQAFSDHDGVEENDNMDMSSDAPNHRPFGYLNVPQQDVDHQSCVSSVTCGLQDADLFVPTMYPSTQSVQNLEDAAVEPGLFDESPTRVASPLPRSVAVNDQAVKAEAARMMTIRMKLPAVEEEGTGVTGDQSSKTKDEKEKLYRNDHPTRPQIGALYVTDLETTTKPESLLSDQPNFSEKEDKGPAATDKVDLAAVEDYVGGTATADGDPQPGAPATTRPGAQAIRPGDRERSFLLYSSWHDENNQQQQQQQQLVVEDPSEKLAEANPVADEEGLMTATEVEGGTHGGGGSSSPTRLLLTFVLSAFVVVGAVLIGAVCGSGHCGKGETTENNDVNVLPVETIVPTTYYRDELEAYGIEWEIKYVLGKNYFDERGMQDGDTPLYLSKTRQQALHWMLHEDPMQLDSSNAEHLLQRFILVLFYLQTTRLKPWQECNPNGQSAFCYPPEESALDESQIWGSVWLSGDHECQWAGVVCQSGAEGRNITELYLTFNKLNGPLPWELSKLSFLSSYQLSQNELTGSIPTQLGLLGPTAGDIALNENFLTGTIPTELFGMGFGSRRPAAKPYTRLSLYHNRLSGMIPTEVGQSGWEYFVVNNNFLSGSLPLELFDHSSLEYLGISGNTNITGKIPSQVESTKLVNFWAASTGLTGTLPSEIGLMTNLAILDVSQTNLGGTLSDTIYPNLSSMRQLSLSQCNFSGTISSSIGLLPVLQILDLADNNFSGTIPAEIAKLTGLYEVKLNGNRFESVPEAVCSLRGSWDDKWELIADCTLDASTGIAPMPCPDLCCTTCCDPTTGICLPT